jgi:methylenetetrahydrofolate dehydrogenase (NADP+)/methenyltetrahydrofolate cyclohydrolase
MPEILDGRKISQEIKSEVASGVKTLRLERGIVPRLHVLLIGNNPASEVYVKSKTKTAGELGISSETTRLSEMISQEQVIAMIDRLNDDGGVH